MGLVWTAWHPAPYKSGYEVREKDNQKQYRKVQNSSGSSNDPLTTAGNALTKVYEHIPGVSSLPGFGGHPGLTTNQSVGNLLTHRSATDFDHKSSLNQHEIAELWILSGGDNSKADLMSAISMAESGGKVRAKASPTACCEGLWQFNTSVGVSTPACANKPSCAGKEAVKVSANGTELTPWESYTNGAYKKYLGKSGVHGTENHTTAGDAVNSVTGGASDIVGFIGRLFEPSFWLRVGKGIMGFLLILFGLSALSKVLLGMDVPNPLAKLASTAAI